MPQIEPHISVKDLTMAYGDFVVMHDLSFTINRGDVFIIMGGSGCGKSTLMMILIGLKSPAKGQVFYGDVNFWESDPETRDRIIRRAGVMYQSGALWSSLTLAENVALPLGEYTDLTPGEIAEVVSLKLSLVGLAGFEEFYPSEISGGMQKRAALARAIAFDPRIIIYDEPTTGLDPIRARNISELVLRLQRELSVTSIVVTHDLICASIISDRLALLHEGRFVFVGTMDEVRRSDDEYVREFLEASSLRH